MRTISRQKTHDFVCKHSKHGENALKPRGVPSTASIDCFHKSRPIRLIHPIREPRRITFPIKKVDQILFDSFRIVSFAKLGHHDHREIHSKLIKMTSLENRLIRLTQSSMLINDLPPDWCWSPADHSKVFSIF